MRRHDSRLLVSLLALVLGAGCVPQAWRGFMPRPKLEAKVAAPTFKKVSLPNGLSLFVREVPNAPVTSVFVAQDAGIATDPAGKEGLTALTEQVAAYGAGPFAKKEIDQAFDALGSPIRMRVSAFTSGYGVTVMPFAAPKALALIADIVRKPRFEPAVFEQVRRVAVLKAGIPDVDPQVVGSRVLWGAVFGKHDPRARRGIGTPASLERITVDDLKQWHSTWIGPNTTAVILTGRVTFAQAVKWTQQTFGDWKGQAKVPTLDHSTTAPKRTKVILIPRPGLAQTVIALGRRGVSAASPDRYPLQMASVLLGQRLFNTVREKEHVAYSPYAASLASVGSGYLFATAKAKTSATGKALDTMMSAIAHGQHGLLPSHMLAGMRLGSIERMVAGLNNTEGLAQRAAEIFWNHRPVNAVVSDLRRLEHIELSDVHKAASTYFDPDTWQIVLVGDPKTIKKQVGSMGLGPIVVVDPNATPAPPAATASK